MVKDLSQHHRDSAARTFGRTAAAPLCRSSSKWSRCAGSSAIPGVSGQARLRVLRSERLFKDIRRQASQRAWLSSGSSRHRRNRTGG